jgi:hypothetical protein
MEVPPPPTRNLKPGTRNVNLPLRYWPDSSEGTAPIREGDLRVQTASADLRLSECALVLVDLWNEHFIESWVERAGRVMKDQVVPVIQNLVPTGYVQ